MKTLIITGGRFDYEFVTVFYKTHHYDRVIAVDNGEQYAKMAGIPIDLLVGDFDTRGSECLEEYRKAGVPIIQSIPEKDDTDTEMAIRECIRTRSDCDILCATGGRLDHLFGNIHNMKLMLDEGLRARMIDKYNFVELANKPFTLNVKEYPHKYISFVPFSGPVTGLTLRGFKYEVSDYSLLPGLSRCISNEFARENAEVSFDSGELIVLNTRDK